MIEGGTLPDLWDAKAGMHISTVEGDVAEVLSETADGQWVRGRYVYSGSYPSLTGTEDLFNESEVASLWQPEQ